MEQPSYHHHPDYDRLPQVIKAQITPEEFAWLLNFGRDNLYEQICYPEPTED